MAKKQGRPCARLEISSRPRLRPTVFARDFENVQNRASQAVAACCRFCWKHSRQKTGLPCVGLKGTVVSLPHCEQVVRVSVLFGTCPGVGAPSTETRFALHTLQRFGSFLNCLSWKNSCSPAVKIKSDPQSIHFSTLSWNSIPHPIPRSPPVRLGKLKAFRTRECAQSRYAPPLKQLPWIRPHLRITQVTASEGNAGHGPWRKSSISECETRGKGMGRRPHGSDPSVVSLAPCELFCDYVSVPRLP